MSADEAPERHPRDQLKVELGLWDATLLVVSGVIGSGIFLTPGAIAAHLPHPGAILLAWLLGGLLSLAGAPRPRGRSRPAPPGSRRGSATSSRSARAGSSSWRLPSRSPSRRSTMSGCAGG